MTSLEIINKIYDTQRIFLNSGEIGELFDIESQRTIEDTLQRLQSLNVLTKLEKGKYFITTKKPSDFEIAQFLYSPSYISFETALNYHGILSQFPVEITSATTLRGINKEILGKNYSYAKIGTRIYTGYYKSDGFLIAYPEKALFDYMYMISKSFKTEEYLNEMDYSNIKVEKLKSYVKLLSVKSIRGVNNLISKYL